MPGQAISQGLALAFKVWDIQSPPTSHEVTFCDTLIQNGWDYLEKCHKDRKHPGCEIGLGHFVRIYMDIVSLKWINIYAENE